MWVMQLMHDVWSRRALHNDQFAFRNLAPVGKSLVDLLVLPARLTPPGGEDGPQGRRQLLQKGCPGPWRQSPRPRRQRAAPVLVATPQPPLLTLGVQLCCGEGQQINPSCATSTQAHQRGLGGGRGPTKRTTWSQQRATPRCSSRVASSRSGRTHHVGTSEPRQQFQRLAGASDDKQVASLNARTQLCRNVVRAGQAPVKVGVVVGA